MNFTIVQLITPNIDAYALYSAASIYHYTQLHGYKYYVARGDNKRGLYPNYTKIDAMKALLEEDNNNEDEYVVFIDADMVLIELDRQLDYFIDKYATEKTQILIPQDVGKESKKKKRPITCVVIVKKSKEGLQIVNDWIDASVKHNQDVLPHYDQGVYWNYVMDGLNEKQVILPLKYFEFSPIQRLGLFRHKKPFLDHLLKRSTEVRVKMMSALYHKYVKDDVLLKNMELLLNENQKAMIEISGGADNLKANQFETELF